MTVIHMYYRWLTLVITCLSLDLHTLNVKLFLLSNGNIIYAEDLLVHFTKGDKDSILALSLRNS